MRQKEHGGTAPGRKTLKGHVPLSDKGQSRDRAASAVGLSGKTVSAAKAIKAASPERFEKIKQGTLTVAKAKKEVKADNDRKQMEKAAKDITADKEKSLLEVCDVLRVPLRLNEEPPAVM